MPTLTETMKSTFWMWAGSMIAVDERPNGMLSAVTMNIDPSEIDDPTARIIYKSAMYAADDNKYGLLPTAYNLATIAIKEGLVKDSSDTPGQFAAGITQLANEFIQYAEAGVSSPASIAGLAASIRNYTSLKRLTKAGADIVKMASDDDLTATDKYEQMAAAVEAARPDLVEARVYTLDDQIRMMGEMARRQQALLGEYLMNLPSEWRVDEYIPYLLPSLLYTFSGLTGRGKSSILRQVAFHLAKCGKTVLYFHLEDDIERQINNYTRTLTGASVMELLAGDARGKYKEAAKQLKEIKKNNRGEVVFVHCPDATTNFIRTRTLLFKPDVIIVDYLQKINKTQYLARAQGNSAAAMEAVVESLKQIAENDKHNCVVIMGSQEAEYENGERKGTAGTRTAEHKAQAVIEFERVKLKETDVKEIITPEQIREAAKKDKSLAKYADGEAVSIADVGNLSGFGYINIVKNNDFGTGSSAGVFNGNTLEFKALRYREWERAHPGEVYPLPRLQAQTNEQIRAWDRKTALWDNIDLFFSDPKKRRTEKVRKPMQETSADYVDGNDDHPIPF